MSVRNPDRPPRESSPDVRLRDRPAATVSLTLGIALVSLGTTAASVLFPLSPKLTTVAAVAAAVASAWLLVLALRATRPRTPLRFSPQAGPYRELGALARRRAPANAPSRAGSTAPPDEPRPPIERRAADEPRPPIERRAAVDRARRVTESSFIAGSNALASVRAVLRGLQDCQQRLSESGSHSEPAGDRDPSALPVAQAFEALVADLGHLAERARRLGSLADAAATLAGAETVERVGVANRTGSFSTGPAGRPRRSPPTRSSLPPPEDGQLLLAALKLRAMAAELEHGLLGLSAEVRALQRARLVRSSVNGEPGRRRVATDASWARAFERLEAQVTELAEQIAGFTRDSEHLSRELDQLR